MIFRPDSSIKLLELTDANFAGFTEFYGYNFVLYTINRKFTCLI